jgi:hypothetical protein
MVKSHSPITAIIAIKAQADMVIPATVFQFAKG